MIFRMAEQAIVTYAFSTVVWTRLVFMHSKAIGSTLVWADFRIRPFLNDSICNAMRKLLLFALALMVGGLLRAQEQMPDASLFVAHRHVVGNDTLPYLLYRSQKADTTVEALPLVIFLHGAGERGNDNVMQLKHCVKYFLDDTITSRYPFMLMAPQCPNEKRWVDTDWSLPEHTMDSLPTTELQGVMAVLDSLIACGAVDSTRVCICGISMGGYGTWEALQRWSEKFAAAIAICGGGDPAYAEAMKDIPIYIFHGLLDGIVMPSRSIQMYGALNDVGNHEAVLVTYPKLEHGCWDEAFSTPGLLKWLFEKKR